MNTSEPLLSKFVVCVGNSIVQTQDSINDNIGGIEMNNFETSLLDRFSKPEIHQSYKTLYASHRTAIQSIQETEKTHVLVIIDCANSLVERNVKVNATTLFQEYLNVSFKLSETFWSYLHRQCPESELDLSVSSVGDHVDSVALPSPSPASVTPAAHIMLNFISAETSSSQADGTLSSQRTSASDSVGALTQNDQQDINVNVSLATAIVAEDVTDNVSLPASRPFPLESTLNFGFKQDNSLLGATASEDSLRPVFKEREGEQQEDRSQAVDARHVKECLWAVQHENKILETYKQCVLCKKNARDITFLPCGHFITCRVCAGPIFTCTLCNRAILATIDTYLS
ncbi:Inhibitor of apoptosis 2 [Biomphalaria pfeifferi]|uniref:Inhibitor of apoptosis 2 n=1 Tax=Biomphalaria pfeifferi TaxID=112525 RepID=A0AAD8EVR0_BIOPF|nr:Inhibitor of apoptosis 2 [Biomphalaria pfeifferi]